MAASSQRAISQSKEALLKSYTMRLREDVQSMLDNFMEIIKLAREDSQLTKPQQTEQDQYEMQVRAANMVRAGESLTKLVSDLKQYIILNDFPSVNDYISQNSQQLRHLQNEVDSKLMAMRDDMAVELYDLEQEYYASAYK